jgi:hypothetical protein
VTGATVPPTHRPAAFECAGIPLVQVCPEAAMWTRNKFDPRYYAKTFNEIAQELVWII